MIEDITSTSVKKILKPQPNSESNDTYTILTTSSDAEPVNTKTTKRLDLTQSSTEVKICPEKMKNGTVDSQPKTRKYLTRQSLRMSLSANNTVSLLDQNVKNQQSNTSSRVEEVNITDHNQESESSLKNSPELTTERQTISALRSVFGDNFREVLKALHNEYEKISIMIEMMSNKFMNNCKTIEELIKLMDEINNDPDVGDIEATIIESENIAVEGSVSKNNLNQVILSEVRNNTQREEEEKLNSNITEVINNNPSNKIRGKASKFTLPPEYDPDDSRWTLKHRKKKDGLVELAQHSKVYVDATQLGNCRRMSKDCKTFARMLLVEIFSDNALKICSLTGKKANAFDFEGTTVRPGLDEHARTVFMNYIEQHTLERKWPKFDAQLIKNTLRNKIQEIRGKYRLNTN